MPYSNEDEIQYALNITAQVTRALDELTKAIGKLTEAIETMKVADAGPDH